MTRDHAGAEDGIVAKVDQARLLLAAARDATDAKKVADLARAAEVYAKRQRLSEEAITYATAVKIDAMTMMGEFLKANEKNKGRSSGNNQYKSGASTKMEPAPQPPTLADIGIGKKESSDAQVLAKVKTQNPALHEEIKAGKKKVSHARVEVKRQEKREELVAKAEAAPAPSGPSWQIITGDCLGHLRGMPSGSVELVFADPPYNIGIDYGAGGAEDELPDKDYLAWVNQWVANCVRVLTPDGSMWVLINDEYAAQYALTLKHAGFTLRNWVIWYETFGVNCFNKFNRTKRHLFYCVKDPKQFTFHPDAVNRPSDRQAKYNDPRAAAGGKILDDVWLDIPRLFGTAPERLPDFPTQLPLALLRRVVSCSSDPGDLVLDPFSGSGTTGAACIELGRRYLGVERSEKFAELSRLRLKGVKRG